jgi:hypothetical protein
VFSTQVRHYYLSSPPQFACQFGPDVLAVLPPATKTHRFPMLFTQQIRPQQRSESNILICRFVTATITGFNFLYCYYTALISFRF